MITRRAVLAGLGAIGVTAIPATARSAKPKTVTISENDTLSVEMTGTTLNIFVNGVYKMTVVNGIITIGGSCVAP